MKPAKQLSDIRPGPNNHPEEEPKAQREEPGQKQHGGKQLRAHAGPTPHSVRRPNQADASRNTDHQPQIWIAQQGHRTTADRRQKAAEISVMELMEKRYAKSWQKQVATYSVPSAALPLNIPSSSAKRSLSFMK
jgi:hypothetical protein